jgi:flagellar motor protein MotB
MLALATMAFASLASVGCVPYQVYKDTKTKLDQALDVNADLVKKYNDAVQRLAARGDSPGSGAQLAQLQKENESLRKQLEGLPFKAAEIQKVPGAEPEDGGMRLGEALLFNEGEAKLKPEAHRVLDEIAGIFSDYPDETFIIEGHTDNQPLVRTKPVWQFNQVLAYNRALEVFKYLVNKGIPEPRMVVYSYSFTKPLNASDQNSEGARSKNRRVVVRRLGTRI